jgi:hypothetical protein
VQTVEQNEIALMEDQKKGSEGSRMEQTAEQKEIRNGRSNERK